MKDQYVGDINDYRKYGLLRLLSGHGALRTAVCWMLTAADGRRDGGKTRYLSQPNKYQHYDCKLFIRLGRIVLGDGARQVHAVKHAGILPNARFYSARLDGEPDQRCRYMDGFFAIAAGCDLVFFDPDNGLEVESTPPGHKGSERYLYWDEARRAFAAGHSVLIYQHFPRRERHSYTAGRAADLKACTGAATVYAFSTGQVLFLLAVQGKHVTHFQEATANVTANWDPQIRLSLGVVLPQQEAPVNLGVKPC